MPKQITKLRWSAINLPYGVAFDENTGTFSGNPVNSGDFIVPVKIETNYGSDTKDVVLNIEDAKGEWREITFSENIALEDCVDNGHEIIFFGRGMTDVKSGVYFTYNPNTNAYLRFMRYNSRLFAQKKRPLVIWASFVIIYIANEVDTWKCIYNTCLLYHALLSLQIFYSGGNYNMYSLKTFTLKNYKIRTIDADGVRWFSVRDLCDGLHICQTGNAVRDSLKHEKIRKFPVLLENTKSSQPDMPKTHMSKHDSPRQVRSMVFTDESGVYTLILRSNKPEAQEFRHWVTSEVLPALRAAGTYTIPGSVQMQQEQEVQKDSQLDLYDDDSKNFTVEKYFSMSWKAANRYADCEVAINFRSGTPQDFVASIRAKIEMLIDALQNKA